MEKQFKDIVLVPTDFSEISENAVKYAGELAEHLGYGLAIVHVKENKQDESKKLHASGRSIEEKGKVKVKYLLKDGDAYKQIPESAVEIKANLIVLGTHGKKGLEHIFGSHAMKIITKAPCPSIVIRDEKFDGGYKDIVFPISDYMESRQMVRWAVHIAKVFNSKIHIYKQSHKDTDLRKRIEIISDQVKEAFEKTEVHYDINESEDSSNYIEQVLDFSKNTGADLIMVMTKPGIFEQDFNLHKWDEKLMYSGAGIPVMCINPLELGDVHYQYVGMI